MADFEALAIVEGQRPETASGGVGVVMAVASGAGQETQWFDYRPAFFSEIVRVEWDKDTMNVVLPVEVSDYLLRHRYARVMTDKEAQAYNGVLEAIGAETVTETPATPSTEVPIAPSAEALPRKSRKGEQS